MRTSIINLLRCPWFRLEWWEYLLKSPLSLRAFWCRCRHHPFGVIWYNVSGLEPDMSCTNCGDDLG